MDGHVYKCIWSATPIYRSCVVYGIKMSIKSPSQMEVPGILWWLPLILYFTYHRMVFSCLVNDCVLGKSVQLVNPIIAKIDPVPYYGIIYAWSCASINCKRRKKLTVHNKSSLEHIPCGYCTIFCHWRASSCVHRKYWVMLFFDALFDSCSAMNGMFC